MSNEDVANIFVAGDQISKCLSFVKFDAVHIGNTYIKWWVMHKEVYVLFGLF